jgi:hypothetical protein
MQNYIKTVLIRFIEKFLFLKNIYLKSVKTILAFVFGLFIALCFIYCVYDGFFVFMIPFAFYLGVYLLLNKYIQSNNWFIGFAKYFILNVITTIILVILAYIFGYYFNFYDYIYCDGEDDIVSNIQSNTDTNNKIILDSDKYYHIRKDSIDTGVNKTFNIISKGLELGIEKLMPNLAGATAAASAAGTILKSNLPPVQKLALAGASAAIVGASTKIGLAVGEIIIKNSERLNTSGEALKKVDPDKLPSPTDTFIPSVLDKCELITPLEELLKYQLIINILILFLIIIFIVLLFNKLFISSNILISFIKNNFNKDIVLKFDFYRIKIEKFNNSFFIILFSINSFVLIFNILLSIFISSELIFNLESYIIVHNDIKNSLCTNFILLGGLSNSKPLPPSLLVLDKYRDPHPAIGCPPK